MIFRIQEHWKHLTVMNIGWCHNKASDKTMLGINADTVLVAVVIDAILFHPAGIYILLLQPIWVFFPSIR